VRGNANSERKTNHEGWRAAALPGPDVGVRMALAAITVSVCALWVTPALGITVDGFVSPAEEWDGVAIHLGETAPEPPIPIGYDVTDIFMAGGTELNFRLDVLDPPVVFGRGVYLRFDFAIDQDPGAGYSISLNDGLGLPSSEIHLVRFPDWNNRGFFTRQDLGQGTYAIGDVLEAAFAWSLFPSEVLETGEITLNRYWYVLESGRGTADDTGEGVLSDPPLPIVPEPATLVGFLLGCGMLARRIRAGRRTLEG